MIQNIQNYHPQVSRAVIVEYGLISGAIYMIAKGIFGIELSLPTVLLAALYVTLQLNEVLGKIADKVLTTPKLWQ